MRTAASAAEGRQPGDLPFMLLYVEFLHALLAVRTAHPERYRAGENAPRLHVIGESHCLTPAHMSLRPGRCVPHLLMGAMAYFFTLEKPNAWQYALQETIRRLPKDEPLIVGFGELDCRATGGIMAQHRSRPDYVIAEAVDELGTKYVQFVKRAQLHRQAPACIAGVPAPNRAVGRDLPPGEAGSFTGMIRDFNAALAREAAQQQLGFIDLYAGTVDHDGWAKDGVHIDHVHLKPSVTAGAIEAAFARRSFAC
ncbi:MAG: SGNH/GDSL hydrolase family protein [Alphaproteobacteria bacterium]